MQLPSLDAVVVHVCRGELLLKGGVELKSQQWYARRDIQSFNIPLFSSVPGVTRTHKHEPSGPDWEITPCDEPECISYFTSEWARLQERLVDGRILRSDYPLPEVAPTAHQRDAFGTPYQRAEAQEAFRERARHDAEVEIQKQDMLRWRPPLPVRRLFFSPEGAAWLWLPSGRAALRFDGMKITFIGQHQVTYATGPINGLVAPGDVRDVEEADAEVLLRSQHWQELLDAPTRGARPLPVPPKELDVETAQEPV